MEARILTSTRKPPFTQFERDQALKRIDADQVYEVFATVFDARHDDHPDNTWYIVAADSAIDAMGLVHETIDEKYVGDKPHIETTARFLDPKRVPQQRIIAVTFETVTPESAEDGDVEARGWLAPIQIHRDDLDEDESFAEHAARLIRDDAGSVEADCYGGGCVPRWFTQLDGNTNWRTGAETRKSYHVDTGEGWSEDERREMARLLR